MDSHAPVVDREKRTVTIWDDYYNTFVTYTFEFIEHLTKLIQEEKKDQTYV